MNEIPVPPLVDLSLEIEASPETVWRILTTPLAVLLGATALLAVWTAVREASGSDLSSVLRQE